MSTQPSLFEEPTPKPRRNPDAGRGFGNVGLGWVGEPASTRTRPDLCASLGHPGATYNPWSHVTACLCGVRWFEGDATNNAHVACCGGPLTEHVTHHPTKENQP